MSYNHLNITDRELIYFHLAQGKSRCQIAELLGRKKSTISRELARNNPEYLTSKAQARYLRDGKNADRIKYLPMLNGLRW